MDRINCDVCRRPHSQKLPFLCVTDARNQLYESRLQNAKLLIENDILEHQINAIVSPPQDVARQEDSAVKAQLVQSWKSEQAAALDRTSQIIAQAERLRLESDAARKELQDRKESVRRRKSDLVSVSEGIAARRSRQIEDIERSLHMSNYKWNRSADQMEHSLFFCSVRRRNSKTHSLHHSTSNTSRSIHHYNGSHWCIKTKTKTKPDKKRIGFPGGNQDRAQRVP